MIERRQRRTAIGLSFEWLLRQKNCGCGERDRMGAGATAAGQREGPGGAGAIGAKEEGGG